MEYVYVLLVPLLFVRTTLLVLAVIVAFATFEEIDVTVYVDPVNQTIEI